MNIKSSRIGVKGSCEAKGALQRAESRLSTRLVNMLNHLFLQPQERFSVFIGHIRPHLCIQATDLPTDHE